MLHSPLRIFLDFGNVNGQEVNLDRVAAHSIKAAAPQLSPTQHAATSICRTRKYYTGIHSEASIEPARRVSTKHEVSSRPTSSRP